MKTNSHGKTQKAFTFWELIAVIAVISVMVTLVWSYVNRPSSRHHPRHCSSNLKQIALSFKLYAADHDQKFPQFDYSDSSSGNPSSSQPLPVWKYFSALSNELGIAKILVCPQDSRRWTNHAYTFSNGPEGLAHISKQNLAISYFVGLNVEETKPNMILTGDRNLAPRRNAALYSSTNGAAVDVSTNAVWQTLPNQTFHENASYYALADGSVQQASNDRLQEALRLARDSYGTNANRFLFPQ